MRGVILQAEQVTVDFAGFKALDQLNLSLKDGELRFLIGPNGAGKTTLIDIISGKVKPAAGRVMFAGRDLIRLQEHEVVRLGIGRKFQTPSVFASLTVYENLELAAGFRDSITDLLHLASRQRERIQSTLETIGLAGKERERAGALSHGEKQWLEIGMLLVQDHKLLLLDEPVAGMTRQERNKTGELLRAIARDRSVLVVEHDMEFVRQFSQTVTVMHEGRVLSEGPVDQVQSDQRVIEVYLGRGRQVTQGVAASC